MPFGLSTIGAVLTNLMRYQRNYRRPDFWFNCLYIFVPIPQVIIQVSFFF